MEQNFNEKESLAVIAGMIEQARNNVQRGAGNSMVLWGGTIAVIALLIVILSPILHDKVHSLWFLCFPVWIADGLMQRKQDRVAIVKTHINTIISSVWVGFVVFLFLFLAVIFIGGIVSNLIMYYWLITPIIMAVCGLGLYATAVACRFRPFMSGALCMWAGALIAGCLIVVGGGLFLYLQYIVLAICMVAAYVVPGIMLNNEARRKNV